jgi:serine/threonine protein phosphatase PrpC
LNILCDTYRDDGSTALTAVLIGQCLYVANVGDSRAIAIKAGKGSILVSYSPFVMSILPKSNVPEKMTDAQYTMGLYIQINVMVSFQY